MKKTVKKLLIGASIAAGMSAIASTPAQAVSFSFNNSNEIKTYTGGSNGTFIANDTVAASNALSDGDASSNVELWYSTENPTSNVGFTATQGSYSATVSSVTAADWNVFGSQWLGELLSTYTPFQSVWNGFSDTTKSLVTSYFPLLGMGDPNIGSFQFGQNGGVELKLVGHLDVKTKLSSTLSATLSQNWNQIKAQIPSSLLTYLGTNLPSASQIDNLLSSQLSSSLTSSQRQQLTLLSELLKFQATLNGFQGEIGASEIAKVVTGGKTYYAYSFNPTASGITASDDGISYSAIYTWNTPGYTPSTSSTSVPEPSLMLGMLGVAGVFAAQRKVKKAQA